MIYFDNYDLEHFVNTVKINVHSQVEPLFSNAAFYNKSNLYVAENVRGSKYLLLGPLFVKIDSYVYESDYVYYYDDREGIRIRLEGPKGNVTFNVNSELDIKDIELRGYKDD
jgi:hypothetical protein